MSIFSSVKSLLTTEEKSSSEQQGNPNFIQHPSRIKHMLQVLCEAHVQITIIFDDKTEHTSRLLSVTSDDIVFDQLNSLGAHKRMLKGFVIQVNAKHHAVPLNFSTTVIETTSDGYYLVALPNKIYHPEKRSFFRIALNDIEKYKVNSIIQFSENSLTGYIYDISYGGISIAMKSDAYIKSESILSPASITLKSGNILHVDLTVRSVKTNQQDGFTRLGCEFLNIDSATKRSLHKFIATYERQRAKR